MTNNPKRTLLRLTQRAGFALALLLAVFSCQRETEDPTGGETHFLVRCQPGDDSCGDSLVCLCGVCTTPCSDRAACEPLPAAACVAVSENQACGISEAAGHCDVACLIDDDCAVLSANHRCELGACRAGAQADAGVCARGEVAPNQVLLLGDSFFAVSHQVTAYLEGLARAAGSLPTGGRYRDNSRVIENGLADDGLAEQYAMATAEADVKVVIMNGGGSDMLIGSCDSIDESCPTIAAAADGAQALLAKMASDGVADVVYAFYPDPMSASTSLRAKIDVLRPLLQSACESSAVDCHWLDLRSAFAGHYAEYVQADGIIPTDAGSQASARAIWGLMQSECVAQ